MRYKNTIILLSISLFLFFSTDRNVSGCTTAVIGTDASANRLPILWKNRDTGFISNKIIYVKETPYSYIGIVNSNNSSGRQVWAGLNEQGFAIMNSVAYNLPKDENELHDLEGIVMADALRKCSSINEFEQFLKKNLGPALGVQTNFGVIDKLGNSAIFEVFNHGYKKLDTKDFHGNYIINTNFSRSGKEGKGAGYLRFERASKIFTRIENGGISIEKIIKNLSRDFGHELLNHPSLDTVRRFSAKEHYWILTKDTIDRSYTSASIIIEGKDHRKSGSVATLWVIPGEPLSSIATPFWVESGTTPDLVSSGKDSPIYKESLRIRKILRPFLEREKVEYIDLTKLVNRDGTGILPPLLKTEKSIIKETKLFLMSTHEPEEYAEFQKKMTEKAYVTLKKIR